MGITVGGSSAGGIIWPIVLNELLNKDGASFGWTIRIVGFIMLPLLVLAVLTVTPPANKASNDHHHRILTEEEQRLETDNGHGSERISQVKAKAHKQGLVALLKNTNFLLLCLGLAISYLGMFSPFFYATSYARSLGHSTSFAFYLVSIVNGASLFGRILPGILADRYGHFNLCGGAALLSGAITLCWTAAKSTVGLVVCPLVQLNWHLTSFKAQQ
ncbi:Riboflavin transporter MCH5 [Beauveria bassiana]|nr:Riboflavin transporter MCH5 [Beauveria bassiana]